MKLNLKNLPLLNVAFNISASLIMRISSLLITSLLVKGIGQAEFGHYIYIITTALMLSTISAMATGQAFIRQISKGSESSFSIYLSNILSIFLLFSGLFFYFYYFVSPNEHITNNAELIFLIALLELINLAYTSYFSGKESFSKIFSARLIFSCVICTIVIYSSISNTYFSAYPYIVALLCSNLYLYTTAKIKLPVGEIKILNWSYICAFYEKYIKISLPIFLSGLMVTPVQWYLTNQIAIQNSFAELGVFNISIQFRMMILMVTNSLATALLPRLVKAVKTDGFEQIKNAGYYASTFFCLIMLIVIFLAMPLIFDFYEITTNSDILTASYLLLATALPLCIYNLYSQVLIAKGKTKSLLLFNSFWGIIVIFSYNTAEVINNLSVAKILCSSYFALIVFVYVFNKLSTKRAK